MSGVTAISRPHRHMQLKGEKPVLMEYYSATKRNEIVLFAEKWMDLETKRVKYIKKRKT